MIGLYSGLYIDHLIFGPFRLTSREKKWIFKLESGVIHVNGRDFVFQKIAVIQLDVASGSLKSSVMGSNSAI